MAAQIIPWNFPLLMLAWKIAPALACGNTVVLKPAETTPLTAMLFADICRQAELPPGVVNLVTGDGTTGAHLVRSDGIDKLAFTGSTEVGKLIMRELAGRDVRLTLELGGKAANIVFDDAALDQAVEGIVNGIYFNQGHVCCAGSRLLVQESIYEPLLEKLKRRLTTLRVGDPLDKNTDVGAINSKAQLEKIRELVASGEDEGAEIFQPECRLPERGYWFVPTLFTNVAQSYRIAQEEIFGPVLSVLTFRTPEEAVEKANNTPYGLSAGVWTEKGSRILWMVERLRAGVVWANTFNRFDPDVAVRRVQGVGLRTRGRPARPRAVPEVRRVSAWRPRRAPFPTQGGELATLHPASSLSRNRPRESARLRVDSAPIDPHVTHGDAFHDAPLRQEDVQALRRRGVPSLRVGTDVRGGRAQHGARVPQGRPRRRPGRPRRVPPWSGMTAYNRGQVLYRLAEMMEARASDLESACTGRAEVEAAIDRTVWYAGWADKLAQVLGSANPVAGPYFDFTVPEPTGVVAILAPAEPPLLGLVSRMLPVLVGGNTVVAVASDAHPVAAVELAEALATSDFPAGAVNVLTGFATSSRRGSPATWT